MYLDFLYKALNVFELGNIGWDANGTPYQSALGGNFIETVNGLIDSLLATCLSCCNEDSLCSG